MSRYSRNIGTLTVEENESLKNFRVCVLGCGGLGGYVIEMLTRLGIGHITAVDRDVFEESNLNRQILSDISGIGMGKAETAMLRAAKVNPDVCVTPIRASFDKDNGERLLMGHDIIIDALDNIKSRLILQELADKLNIPFVHGAIGGWYGQVTTVFPGDFTLNDIYCTKEEQGMEQELGNPSFTPALVASIEVSEALKVLIGRGELLRKKLLQINLLSQEYVIIDL